MWYWMTTWWMRRGVSSMIMGAAGEINSWHEVLVYRGSMLTLVASEATVTGRTHSAMGVEDGGGCLWS